MGSDLAFQSKNSRNNLPSVESTVGDCPVPSCDAVGADFRFGFLDPALSAAAPDDDSNATVWPEAPQVRPLIPPGDYLGEVLKHSIHRDYRFPTSLKLVLQIQLYPNADLPESVVLARFLNYDKKMPGLGTDYYKEWVKANANKAPRRRDEMSPLIFRRKQVLVRVRTVGKDRDGDALGGDLRYSIIGKIIEVL